MAYLSAAQIAAKWGISERSVRNYCAQGRVPGAFLTGKTWNIPEDAEKPVRANAKGAPKTLLKILQAEQAGKVSGGIYHFPATGVAQIPVDLVHGNSITVFNVHTDVDQRAGRAL